MTNQDPIRKLNQLVGLDNLKREFESLANLLLFQQKRREAGLLVSDVSQHLVFKGPPGTGKTTVARIYGEVLASLGILKKGHLIETDRSGLVAEYTGQTAPKTNRTIDAAIDGVLFIDEAYSLVAEDGHDSFGREAVQTLLKRMEDDRNRLAIVLADYATPIAKLLETNPGLRSRFSRHIEFQDYRPESLAEIFETMCKTNQFQPNAEVRVKILLSMHWLYSRRDKSFGNGRLVRNVFEDAIRRIANRLAETPEITQRSLTEFLPLDVDVPGVPDDVLDQADDYRLQLHCPGCKAVHTIPLCFVARGLTCRCGTSFQARWGDVEMVSSVEAKKRQTKQGRQFGMIS